MFTPTLGTQITAIEKPKSVCKNDEEYGLRYGRVTRSTWSVGLLVAAIVILFLILA